jgi:hypothetical protein
MIGKMIVSSVLYISALMLFVFCVAFLFIKEFLH